jgi:hypothetical protein
MRHVGGVVLAGCSTAPLIRIGDHAQLFPGELTALRGNGY